VGNGETILVAEDELSVRNITASILEQFGYRVVTAADGAEAIRIFKEHEGEVRLLLLDINMPHVDGRTAFHEIRCMRPDIRVLFTSGYTEDFIRSKGLLDDGAPVVSKPVSPRDLLRKIREVLEQ
jgi:CheY-like chemotaxis protein